MDKLFVGCLFGLLIGDYMLQPKKMAIRKSENSYVGSIICLTHCSIVTLATMLTLKTIELPIIILIFFSHYIVDRGNLALHWLRYIKGRDFQFEYYQKYKFQEIHLIFSCIVYLIVDNTIHLLILYYGIPILRSV